MLQAIQNLASWQNTKSDKKKKKSGQQQKRSVDRVSIVCLTWWASCLVVFVQFPRRRAACNRIIGAHQSKNRRVLHRTRYAYYSFIGEMHDTLRSKEDKSSFILIFFFFFLTGAAHR